MTRRREDALQRAIVTYLRAALSQQGYRVFAVPNGGARTKIEGAIMKATGTLAGVADLQILGPGGRSWFIEVKTDEGRLSPPQQDFQFFCIARGVPYAVCRSIDDVKAALLSWGLDRRAAA